jgi:YjbE family integral membrane protein
VWFLPNAEFWGRLASVVLIDLALAGDNALVIALAVRRLPRHVQTAGVICGSLGAIILRIGFTLAAASLLRLSGVQILAATLLLWIAFRLVRPLPEREHRIRGAATLLEALWIITLADVAMSFDNVLAIAAIAAGDSSLVAIGIGLSLPLVVGGSRILSRLMNAYPWAIWVGGGVLGYVAGDLCLRDPLVAMWRRPDVVAAPAPWFPLALGLSLLFWGWQAAQPPGILARLRRTWSARSSRQMIHHVIHKVGSYAGGDVIMKRALLVAVLALLVGNLIAVGRVYRYQYIPVVGAAPNTKIYAQTDYRRVDRWTGRIEAWVCAEVDTTQVANVPPAPKPSDYDNQETPDPGKMTGEYFVVLNLWRKAFPHVNPDTLHVTETFCRWAQAP